MAYLEILAGLLLLTAGGDALVRGAVAIARRAGISPLLVGLVIVGFGTSTPELVTSVAAALAGSPGIAVGNVVGSNIANILLILGMAAVIRPFATARSAIRRDGTVVLLAAIACAAIVLHGQLGRPVGAGLVMLLVTYIVYAYVGERTAVHEPAPVNDAGLAAAVPTPDRLWVVVACVLGGLALTMLGAELLVTGAITLARAAGISETVLGLTIVAVGTSLPELVTSVMAAIRRQAEVAFGNIIGSNIYNVLGILGVTALVEPIAVPPEIAALDIWVMLAATVLMLVSASTGWRLSRAEGTLFLGGYAGYLAYLASLQPSW